MLNCQPVLLMGQQFLSEDAPWIQLLQQLDLPRASAEEFVGALEAAAQASKCRALVMIDALNEGNGRKIWPTYLSSFLARLERSPWIGLVLSVRSSYEEDVIPKDVRQRAAHITHHGFNDHEYDAVKTFFTHYGLEFQSAPILQPEFRNPLFLKTLCQGLHDSGERRIPKGFHGIAAAFDLYLKEINARLAKPESLDYDPKNNLVRQALEGIAERLAEGETRWLLRSEAQTVIDALLQGRGYSKSLYHALVAEGILTENMDWSTGELTGEVVFITYDRFADHIIADHLLSTHLDTDDLDAAFSKDSRLALLCEGGKYVSHGLIEALCIQIPERTGKELVRLAPSFLDNPSFGDAFLESIVWRKLDAFSEDTRVVLRELLKGEEINRHPLDVLLSVSTIPDHPLNANFIDQRLRQDSMPDRDAWWSTYLHRAWQTDAWNPMGAIHRLVDWASGVSARDNIDDEAVDLATTTLAWFLTTPNRFLRDSATKALVTLLTGKLDAVKRMVARFSDVDDPYVRERVYSVAYGVAMRSHDAVGVEKLASLVYKKVFASSSSPVHILLRDYARGVVERAIQLGAGMSINQHLIRPPYNSSWPDIPGEDVIKDLTPNWNRGAWVDGDLEWSRNRIRHSVVGEVLGDFARYVIGTESESNWLHLRLDEEIWQSPDERIQAWVLGLSRAERLAWDDLRTAKSKVPPILPIVEFVDEAGNEVGKLETHGRQVDRDSIEQARMNLELARSRLMAELTEERRAEWVAIRQDEEDLDARHGPRFDKRLIQRYILWRVFDLGWTVERFGKFDRFDIREAGRTAFKAERMGKKYQWIAYHEILAYIADHYQYRERYAGESAQHRYEGPWQESLRDIDPSCTLSSTPGGTSWGPHRPAWWGREQYDVWDEDVSHQDWIADSQRLPEIEKLLEVVNPNDRTLWLNVDGSFVWRQPHPADQEPYDHDRRELWIGLTGYFVRTEEAESFMSWGEDC